MKLCATFSNKCFLCKSTLTDNNAVMYLALSAGILLLSKGRPALLQTEFFGEFKKEIVVILRDHKANLHLTMDCTYI